ncbi:hypothetical protein ACG04Q_16510 [Roseateles sp. DXS20W]|uniref:SPOR domain-containing protein n=1 Tax=Pelomonas lactea TaxID=3299030 RepID=A0ABW7GML3_9BURK
MERLPEQIVDWHNRHPLARRIGVGDVHTVGVVALPFVRATAQAGGFAEPVLTDAVSAFDELHGSPPVSRGAVWLQRLQALPARLAGRLPGRQPRTQWRAFSEKFLPGLGAGRIERFALAHGFAEPPATPESQPWRVIVIDEKLASAHGGWPFELYLMSAGIDVGSARTRVLCGRGIPSQIIGRRLWDPRRLAIAAAVVALLGAVAAWALWPRHAAEPAPEPPAAAASSPATAPPPVAPAEPASAASVAEHASAPASQAVEPAAVPVPAASLPDASDSAASQPDIRPRLVERADGITRPPLRADKPAPPPAADTTGKTTERPGTSPAEKTTERSAQKAIEKAVEPVDPRLVRMAESPTKIAVALVGPPGNKADAEALLKKMKESLKGVHGDPDSLQADVIQTPEGWRATVWPFPSREQAQLINATLVARGLKTKAVNF